MRCRLPAARICCDAWRFIEPQPHRLTRTKVGLGLVCRYHAPPHERPSAVPPHGAQRSERVRAPRRPSRASEALTAQRRARTAVFTYYGGAGRMLRGVVTRRATRDRRRVGCGGAQCRVSCSLVGRDACASGVRCGVRRGGASVVCGRAPRRAATRVRAYEIRAPDRRHGRQVHTHRPTPLRAERCRPTWSTAGAAERSAVSVTRETKCDVLM